MHDISNNLLININLKECYICYEDTDLLSPCNCKTLYLHKQCQEKFIKLSKNNICKICNKEYTNVKMDIYKKKIVITLYGKRILYNICFITFINGILFVEFYYGLKDISNNYYLFIIAGIFSTFLLTLFYIFINDVIYIYKNNIKLFKIINKKRLIII